MKVHAYILDLPGCGIESGQCFTKCQLPSAYISTLRFPSDIQATETCSWTIEGKFGQYVELEVLHLDIVDDSNACAKTSVTVYDVTLTGEESAMKQMCKNDRIFEPISSSWHKMKINFRSGGGIGKGFQGRYTLVDFSQELVANHTLGKFIVDFHNRY